MSDWKRPESLEELAQLVAAKAPTEQHLNFARGLFQPEPIRARQYEPETLAAKCPSCGVVFRVLRFQETAPWLVRHLVECGKRSEKDRAFYRAKRRWPTRKPDAR